MNVDSLLRQYFPTSDNVCIELFDEKNIQQVYRWLVEVLIHQPEVKLLLEMPLAELKARTTFTGTTRMTELSILSAFKTSTNANTK